MRPAIILGDEATIEAARRDHRRLVQQLQCVTRAYRALRDAYLEVVGLVPAEKRAEADRITQQLQQTLDRLNSEAGADGLVLDMVLEETVRVEHGGVPT